MAKPNPFDLTPRQPVKITDIETLFIDLKGRSENIQYLRSLQADVLRDYYKSHIKSRDVGIELPTGSGKTLVGLLIAEWRRRYLRQRILYLCPTRQLVNQVHQQSKDYDINTHVFVGSKKEYNPGDLSKYQSSETIALTTYRGLFNISPGIDDPQTIILDDAHGAESYIGDMWSLNISRQIHPDLFNQILEIFEKDLPHRFIEVIHSGNRERVTHLVEKVPFGAFYRSLSGLRSVLESIDDSDLSLYFSWRVISDGLHACHVYISFDSILIRPYIPPTKHHRPFDEAEQRIYMSATLGRGGELERITGADRIQRIATPRTYETRGVGRRLYLFPDYAISPDDYYPWIIKRLASVGRSLVLCPSGYRAKKYNDFAVAIQPSLTVFTANDIEEKLEPFITKENSLLLLTNRYDGIDLPGGVCRQVIIDGLPSSVNLQEAFLEERLSLDILLRERIKTRIQQASGRCTRADIDSAAILMLDRKLFNYCARAENLQIFHPELKAELTFALRQGTDSVDKMDAMLESFIIKDENWAAAEKVIESLRSTEPPPESMETKILSDIVDLEVDFSYAMWSGDYQRAVERGRSISDMLAVPSLNSYRALWYYFTASAAMTAPPEMKTYDIIKTEYIDYAKAAGRYISWFPNALNSMESVETVPEEDQERQALAVEGIIEVITELNPVGPKFMRKLDEVQKLIKETNANKFDTGLRELGKLLGYSSLKPPGDGAPDACWQLENSLLFLLEGKSDENPDYGISIDNCRQTSGHLKYATDRDNYKDVKDKYTCLVTPRKTINESAIPHGEEVYYINTQDIIKLFERARQMLTESRALLSRDSNENIREKIAQIMSRLKLTPSDVLSQITSRKVTELPKVPD